MTDDNDQTLNVTQDQWWLWLRAGKPDLAIFLSMSDMEQETVADLGDEYLKQQLVALTHALRDPESFRLGAEMANGNGEADVEFVANVVDRVIQSREQPPASARRPPAADAGNGPTLMGKKADPR